jgi:hypothetical protein
MLNVDFGAAIVNSPRAVSLSTSGKACLLPRISDHCAREFVNVTVIGGYADVDVFLVTKAVLLA